MAPRIILPLLLAVAEALNLTPFKQARVEVAPPPTGFIWGETITFNEPVQNQINVLNQPGTSANLLSRFSDLAPNTAEATAVFTSIGRGVGVAAQEYVSIAAVAAVEYSHMAAERVKENAPDATAVFVDIGRGVGVAAQEYVSIAAGAVQAFVSYVNASAPRRPAANQLDASAGANQVDLEVKVAMLKVEGEAVIAKRAELAAALRAELAASLAKAEKIATLKAEGEAVIARRAELGAALASRLAPMEEPAPEDGPPLSAPPPTGFKWAGIF